MSFTKTQNKFSKGIDDKADSTSVTIDGDGNVGIGREPTDALDIAGGITVQQQSFIKWQNTARNTTFGGIKGDASDLSLTWDGDKKVILSPEGNVGIGESSPAALLHLKSNEPDLILEDADSGSAIGSRNRVRFRNGSGTYAAQIGNDPTIDGGANFSLGTFVGYGIDFFTNSDVKMRLTSNGRLRLGEYSTSGSAGSLLDLTFINGNNTEHNGIAFQTDNVAGRCFINLERGASSSRGDLIFGASNAERARITWQGNFLVNSTVHGGFKQKVLQDETNKGICALHNSTTSGLNYDQFQVLVDHASSSNFHLMRCYVAGGSTVQFAVRGDGVVFAKNTAIQSLSDGRIKENVRDSEQGLDVITELRPVRFDFKEGFGNNQKNQLGFIAQEVEAVFPDAVMEASEKTKRDEPLKSLGPAALIPVMVKALQELSNQVDELKAEVAALKGE